MSARVFSTAAVAIGAMYVAATAAEAGTVTTYSDITTFDAAHGPVTVEDFTANAHFPLTSGVLNSATTDAGLTAGEIEAGVTYSTTVGTGNFFNIDAGGGFVGGFLDSLSSTGERVLSIVFDGAVSGFGFVTNGLMPTFEVTIDFLSGPSYTGAFSISGSGLEFFGFGSSAQDIKSVTIDGTASNNFNFALDDFRFGETVTSPAVPLPAGLPIALTAFATLGFAARRRKGA